MLITVLMYHFESMCRSSRYDEHISQNKLEEAAQGWEKVYINEHVFYRFYHFTFAHKQVSKFCVYVYVFVFGSTSKVPELCTLNCSIQFSKNSVCFIRT